MVEFRTLIAQKNIFSAQSARTSSRVTLSPSYTKQRSSSIDLVAWPAQREGCRGEFQKKILNEILLTFIANVRDFYTIAFACGES